jgi:hypothetical protein
MYNHFLKNKPRFVLFSFSKYISTFETPLMDSILRNWKGLNNKLINSEVLHLKDDLKRKALFWFEKLRALVEAYNTLKGSNWACRRSEICNWKVEGGGGYTDELFSTNNEILFCLWYEISNIGQGTN